MKKAENNIAVIGSGYWGKNLVRNFANLGALNTVCDADTTVLREIVAKYPAVNQETDLTKVLNNSDIKGVVVASPAILHYSMAREALQAGKDVFVEKPLSLTIEEGNELVALAQDRDLILMVGHLLEYHPAITKLKELVDTGALGKIQYIYSNRVNLGKVRTEENILWSFAPHDISVILLMLGGEMPFEVASHGAYYLNKEIADVTLSTLTFKDGIKAHIFVSWLHPYKDQRLVVIGTRKMAVFNDTSPDDKLLLYDHHIEWLGRRPIPAPGQTESIPIIADEPLRLECMDFIHCIKTRQKPRVDGKKGLQVLKVLSYCQKSLEQNGSVISTDKENANYFIHPTSIIEQPCQIGIGTRIWHFSHIMPGVTIGDGSVIGQNVFIGKGITVGRNVKIENNVSIFEGVTLEDDVFCGPSCVFTNVINPRSHVSRKREFKKTIVKTGASIGANATIVCGNPIGKYAFIGAGSVVTKEVFDYALVYGNPAHFMDWICECGEKLKFDKGKTSTTCIKCGKHYKKHTIKGKPKVERL